jgi:glycogen phosphorylase
MTIVTERGTEPAVAYFSMEVGLDPKMPTYSGGLGVLAGDTLRAAADLGVRMVGVSLLHRKGYFRQRLDERGNQIEEPAVWTPESYLIEMPPRVTVRIAGRAVLIRAWRYDCFGHNGARVPVYLLDTDMEVNDAEARAYTDYLYGGAERYRLCQEAVLGLGGIAMLRALGYADAQVYHLNEGHAALLTLALLEGEIWRRAGTAVSAEDVENVRRRCVFTTHTPVAAGHDQFTLELAREVLGPERITALESAGGLQDSVLNLTYVALRLSHYVNGVAMRHGEVAQGMFPSYPVNSITNGVHALTWTSPSFRRLYDRTIPEWRRDNLYLRYAINLPLGDIIEAHAEAKADLLREVARRTGAALDPSVLTLGFARRATAYKRADLLFEDLDRLGGIVRDVGPIQVIYGGKSHPRDESGKALIRRVFECATELGDRVKVVYLEEYDMSLGYLLCSGVDVWLNTPLKPLEASGTSGMKAALNGVPSFSVLDGWWIEGHVEAVTGWAIGDEGPVSRHDEEVASLYDQLELEVIPLFYRNPLGFAEVMRSTIALNGSFFNAQRMLQQYVVNAYRATAG